MTSRVSSEASSTSAGLEALFERIGARELRVNNLFQIDGGIWRANLRSEGPTGKHTYYHNFADGGTALEAMQAAFELSLKEFSAAVPVAESEPVSWEDL